MRAISLWQPWATLVAIEEKKWETRSWLTDYRGPLIIHAAKHFTKVEARITNSLIFRNALTAADYLTVKNLPLGAYLCVVDLVDIYTTKLALSWGLISEQERAFGDYTPGRYAWKLENVRRFPEPVLANGQRRFWNPLKDVDPAMRQLIENLYQK